MTVGMIRGYAFGLLGLSRETFYTMRPSEYFEALHYYMSEKNADRRHMGELVRGATMLLFNLQLKPAKRIKDPHLFWAMPWDDVGADKEAEIQRLNNLSQDERDAEAKEFLKKIHGI